jgi:hypothetical protein
VEIEGKMRVSEAPVPNSEVRECLERILRSPAFRASTRPKQFLTFVVERKLAGRQDEIKERTIGAEVFGRTADFETAGDSIVRVNANEVRRRLAQYYKDPPVRDGVQIMLPAGTYVPEFTFLGSPAGQDSASSKSAKGPDARRQTGKELVSPLGGKLGSVPVLREFRQKSAAQEEAVHGGRPALWWTAGGAAAILVALWLTVALRAKPSPLDRFWLPVVRGRPAPVLCLPTTDTFQLSAEVTRDLQQLQPGGDVKLTAGQVMSFHNWHTSWPVLQATLDVSAVLQGKGRTPLVRIGTDLKTDELRGHPVIAIGSFSNPWTRQNVAGLRFTFDRGASDRDPPRIRDAKNPQRSWSLEHVFPEPQDKDYAIVTRTFNPATGEPFVSLAGLHSFGCQIAADFVSEPSLWEDLSARAPNGWEEMNLQVVLETNVIGTTPSPPKIVDAYFWK